MNGCIGLVGMIFGHKFRPRFDSKQEPNPQFQSHEFEYHGPAAAMILRTITYVEDVCQRCGKRSKQP